VQILQNYADLAKQVNELPNLDLMGLMAVAPLDEDTDAAFSRLAKIHSGFQASFPRQSTYRLA
jgi:uncharacterized pyridoxal phosphate-containing UPF0001 family protein